MRFALRRDHPALEDDRPVRRQSLRGKTMKIDNFFAELKRRNVYKVAVAYAVVGWLLIQVSSTVLPTFHAPEWVVQTLVVLVAIGFPIALVIAWAFELTPEGIRQTEDADLSAARSAQTVPGRRRDSTAATYSKTRTCIY